MKKSYLMIAAAATLLTACMGNDTFKEIANENVMIGFETFHEKSTKATATDLIDGADDLTDARGGFGVWGYKGSPASIKAYTGSNDMDLSQTAKYTNVFNNIKVWYDATTSTSQNHAHFKYAVPKYWDKYAEYVFFAYAPFDGTNAVLTPSTGIITISDIASIQDISDNNEQSGDDLVYTGIDASAATDYLIASCVNDQKYGSSPYTNQHGRTYSDAEQTVGFTFGHMLSKLSIKIQAFDKYNGVKEIKVDTLTITNMPATSGTKAIFTQTSPNGTAGTYVPLAYTSKLKVIENGTVSGVSSGSSLYILKDGSAITDNGTGEITGANDPDDQPQQFNYFVAPNDPTQNTTPVHYILDLGYTTTYVDDISEHVCVNSVDLNSILPKLEQNYYYILTIKIKMNEILFTVDAITDWDPTNAGVNNTQELVVVIE